MFTPAKGKPASSFTVPLTEVCEKAVEKLNNRNAEIAYVNLMLYYLGVNMCPKY
jgi:hypothetical protein